MEKKIILEDTKLVKLGDNTEFAGAVAVAIAMKRPEPDQTQPGEPNTSPCWLSAIVATDEPGDVDRVRLQFAEDAKIDPKELKNVITLKTGGANSYIAEALRKMGGGGAEIRFLNTDITILSCSIGGKGTSVFTGAGTKPSHFDASWGLAKGIKLGDGNCACKEVKVWTRALTPDEVAEFNSEVSTFGGFKCD